MTLIQLIHVSRAPQALTLSALVGLMVQCRERNRIEGITGLLIYHEQQFIQLFEGESRVVADLYDTICRDQRNTRNQVLFEATAPRRDFTDWSMAFLAPEAIGLDSLPGYSRFLERDFHDPAFTGRASAARSVLWQLRGEVLRHAPVG